MPGTLHDFLDTATQRACDGLIAALLALPADKRNWKPGPKARNAVDQVAECAVINGYVVPLIQNRKWPIDGYEPFKQDKVSLIAQGEDILCTRLRESTKEAIAAVRSVPEDALGDTVSLPWGDEKMAEILLYSYWNMSYHTGQITYIKSLLPDTE